MEELARTVAAALEILNPVRRPLARSPEKRPGFTPTERIKPAAAGERPRMP